MNTWRGRRQLQLLTLDQLWPSAGNVGHALPLHPNGIPGRFHRWRDARLTAAVFARRPDLLWTGANKRRWPGAALLLGQRRRRLPNITAAPGQRLVLDIRCPNCPPRTLFSIASHVPGKQACFSSFAPDGLSETWSLFQSGAKDRWPHPSTRSPSKECMNAPQMKILTKSGH